MEDIWEWVHLTSGTYHIINQKKLMNPWVFNMAGLHRLMDHCKGDYMCVQTCQSAHTHAHTHTNTPIKDRILDRWKNRQETKQRKILLHVVILFIVCATYKGMHTHSEVQVHTYVVLMPRKLGPDFLSDLLPVIPPLVYCDTVTLAFFPQNLWNSHVSLAWEP